MDQWERMLLKSHIVLQFKKNFFKYAIRRKTNNQNHFANVSLGMKSESSD